MRQVKRLGFLLGAIAAFALALFIVSASGLPNRADYTGQDFAMIGYTAPEIASIAPPFTAITLRGENLDLLNLRGETVIINFWATWCIPCQAEMPELQTLYEETGVKILAVNIGEDAASIQNWRDYYGLSFDILLDPEQNIYDLYQVRGQPSTYILDHNGIITHIFYGATTADALRAAINLTKQNG